MQINVYNSPTPPPVERCHVMTMVVKSFKGRRDVDVHLFRPDFDPAEAEAIDWNPLIGDPMHPDLNDDPELPRRIVMEAFTAEERDQVVEYLKERYEGKLESINASPMGFPVPLGMPPLSAMPEGKTIGFIRFEKTPRYPLPFAMHGMYDLAQHEPLAPEHADG